MAESIAIVGLLQNLCVVADGAGGFGVVAGGRRLRGLQLLAEQGRGIDTIPVRIAPSAEIALEWANAENHAREALNPAQEIRSYAAMRDAGHDKSAIAISFAQTTGHVTRRLALAGLSPVILDALEAGEITLDHASHYTINQDQELQARVFADLGTGWNSTEKRTIHHALVGSNDYEQDRQFEFVGREAYIAAGGIIHEDLFGEDMVIANPEILEATAIGILEQAAEDIRTAEGWAWVEVRPHGLDYSETEHFGRAYPTEYQPTEAEAARYDEIAEMAPHETNDEALCAEYEELGAKMNTSVYSAQQKGVAGLFVSIRHGGHLSIERGLIRPDDFEAAEAAGVYTRQKTQKAETSNDGPKPIYSAKLAADLGRLRTGIAQHALANDPALALDLLTFTLADRYFGITHTLDVHARFASGQPETLEGVKFPKGEGAERTHARTAKPATIATSFEKFRANSDAEKGAALANAVAVALSGGLANERESPLFEVVAKMAGADLRSIWTPDDTFFARLSKSALIGILESVLEDPARTTPMAKAKKGDLVKTVAKYFAKPEAKPLGLSSEQIDRIKAWEPEHVGFAA